MAAVESDSRIHGAWPDAHYPPTTSFFATSSIANSSIATLSIPTPPIVMTPSVPVIDDPLAPEPLDRVMRRFADLVHTHEQALLRAIELAPCSPRQLCPIKVRTEARRLAVEDLHVVYKRKHIGRSLRDAEILGRRAEEQLLAARAHPADDQEQLCSIHNGYFRLYSSELFDLLGKPTDVRFGTLRFHRHMSDQDTPWISVELALGSAFFIADSMETRPFHAFKVPQTPSLQNRGILSRKPEDNGAFPAFDSWLLMTFLGDGCLKVEVPIEMCADVYAGPLQGRNDEDVQFWGLFVDDEW